MTWLVAYAVVGALTYRGCRLSHRRDIECSRAIDPPAVARALAVLGGVAWPWLWALLILAAILAFLFDGRVVCDDE